jgi:cytoskeleton protein RodZ
MNDEPESAPPLQPEGPTAGALLRAAREKQGMHIAALAAAIKVPTKKLEALEGDRYEDLPDLTFARALAQTVCRALKIDAQPVLARLPQGASAGLDQVGRSLNMPFRERPGRVEVGSAPLLRRPLVWAGGALLLGALAVSLFPESSREPAAPAPAAAAVAEAAPAASAVAEPASAAATVAVAASEPIVETVFSAPAPESGDAAPVTASPLQLRTTEPSWVEVQDARGRVLLSRTVLPDESVGLDGAMPLRLTIGNAVGTQVVFRGQAVDVAAAARDNVARLELK